MTNYDPALTALVAFDTIQKNKILPPAQNGIDMRQALKGALMVAENDAKPGQLKTDLQGVIEVLMEDDGFYDEVLGQFYLIGMAHVAKKMGMN